MQSSRSLQGKIRSIDGKGYGAYQSLKGEYAYPEFELFVSHVPRDPYAPPHTGMYRIRVTHEYLGIPQELIEGKTAQVACRDFLARRFCEAARRIAGGRRGTGHSGVITMDTPAQAILDRSSMVLTGDGTGDGVEARLFVGLPANGRRINAGIASKMLFEELPAIVKDSFGALDIDALRKHIEAAEDAEYLRGKLDELDLVAFVADGSILPRKSGTSDRPMDKEDAIPFSSPESLRVAVDLPHVGPVTGLGIPRGVTLIVGGGYHGKSTLLHAIERGIYNHIPGDGRELCATKPDAVKVRAYSGRSVSSVDISAFIDNLPFGKDTTDFSSPNASGSTSQAASIAEALEAGARVLLMDEDTCAANFMVRDLKMQQLVKKEDEPITTYIDSVRQLYEEEGVSSILVLGGVGDYFEVADTVIQMVRYEPRDVTAEAKNIVEESPAKRRQEHRGYASPGRRRLVHTKSIDPRNKYGKKSVRAVEASRIHFGSTTIDLSDVEQLVERSQFNAVAQAIVSLGGADDEAVPIGELVGRCMQVVADNGLDGLSGRISGNLAQFRSIDLACALNRMRNLTIEQC
jgi:predicted ABC-class ATPase